ncbi:phage antirepressor [Levilactobacillus sp. N40-8-2]|uniref:phage antirepressor n=1 Tax=Levilactobacillus muriae TaxID=3238987 RepID=UPI0038B339C4
MNQITPFNFEGNQVRTVLIDNEPHFVGKDVAIAIGYKNFRDALNKHVKSKYKRESQIATPSGIQMMTLISEPGVYQLAGQSKLPSAEPFQDWIYEQVLPSIRKQGAYVTPKTAYEWMADPDNMIQFLEKYKSAQQEVKRLHDENEAMQPKALFADAVSVSSTSILVGDLAKLIKQNGVDIGANRLFKWLREKGYLINRKGTDWNMPTQRSMELKLFKVKETSIQHSDGHVSVNKTPKVTGKGQQYFINRFLNDERTA